MAFWRKILRMIVGLFVGLSSELRLGQHNEVVAENIERNSVLFI